MANNLRQLVSKKKKRFDDGDFNLDLSYISPQIIAMGVPAETFERIYRNDINEVARFLETRHPQRYKVYNLCVERTYNIGKFKDRVELFPMHDHNPPLIHTIPYFCNSVYKWLQKGLEYVAAIHCKAGKGRTGVMICCYLLYESFYGLHDNPPTCLTADQVLELYDKKRTHNNKGVTIPSQRRYVYYYAHVLRNQLAVENCVLALKSVTIEGGLPAYQPGGGCCLMFKCKKLVRDCQQDNKSTHRPIGESDCFEPRRGQPGLVIRPPKPIPVNGDVKMVFYNRTKVLARYRIEKVFHCWFNTFFVVNQPADTPGARWRQRLAEGLVPTAAPEGGERDIFLTLTKQELDKACKDALHKIYPEDFAVTLQFEVPAAASDDTDASQLRPFAFCPMVATDAEAGDVCSLSSSSCSSLTDDSECELQEASDPSASDNNSNSNNSNNNNSSNNNSNNSSSCSPLHIARNGCPHRRASPVPLQQHQQQQHHHHHHQHHHHHHHHHQQQHQQQHQQRHQQQHQQQQQQQQQQQLTDGGAASASESEEASALTTNL